MTQLASGIERQMAPIVTGFRDKVKELEGAIAETPGAFFGDNEKCPLKHLFGDGIYVRSIFIPKGMLIVGKIHKHSHPNFLMLGNVSVVTESGGIERLKAPHATISPAGTKRVVYAHEDTVWITCHVTDETDLVKIEEQVIAKSYNELDDNFKAQVLEVIKVAEDTCPGPE